MSQRAVTYASERSSGIGRALLGLLPLLAVACGPYFAGDRLEAVSPSAVEIGLEFGNGSLADDHGYDTAEPPIHACAGLPGGWSVGAVEAWARYDTGTVRQAPAEDPGIAAAYAASHPAWAWTCWSADGDQPDAGGLDLDLVPPAGNSGAHTLAFAVGAQGEPYNVAHKTVYVDTAGHPLNELSWDPAASPSPPATAWLGAVDDRVVAVYPSGSTWRRRSWTEAAGWTDSVALNWGDLVDLVSAEDQVAALGSEAFALSHDAAGWSAVAHGQGTAVRGLVHDGSEWLAYTGTTLYGGIRQGAWLEVPLPLEGIDLIVGEGSTLLALGDPPQSTASPLVLSTNGGASWASVPAPATSGELARLGVADDHLLILERRGDEWIGWASDDQGSTWAQTDLGGTGSLRVADATPLDRFEVRDGRAVAPGLVGAVVSWAADEGFVLHHYVIDAVLDGSTLAGDRLVVVDGRPIRTATWHHPPALEAGPPPAGDVGLPYSWNVPTTGQVASLAVSGGQLPPGLALTDGRVAGTPTQAGSFEATLHVEDDVQRAAERAYTFTIMGDGDTAADTGPTDTATGDTGDTGDAGPQFQEIPGCGCATGSPRGAAPLLLLALVLATAGTRRRSSRRSPAVGSGRRSSRTRRPRRLRCR